MHSSVLSLKGYKCGNPINSESRLWLADRRKTSEDKWPFPIHAAANENIGKQHIPISHEWRHCDLRKVWVNTDTGPWVGCRRGGIAGALGWETRMIILYLLIALSNPDCLYGDQRNGQDFQDAIVQHSGCKLSSLTSRAPVSLFPH